MAGGRVSEMNDLRNYKEFVTVRISELMPFLQKYAFGDFSDPIPVPEEEDEFTELLVGINLMTEDLNDMVDERDRVIKDLRTAEETIARDRENYLALFDGIEDVIYVSHPETYELIFVNESVKKNWGDDMVGKKCYRALQNRATPCPFCTNDLIFGKYMGQVYTWEFQNEITENWYRCADKAIRWPSGDLVRFDITKEKETFIKLEKANNALTKFNRIAVDRELQMIDMKQTINGLQKELGRELQYDLSFLEDETTT